MNFNEETINKLANLLMIELNEDESKMILDEFNEIDKNINTITKIDNISDVEPMTHPIDNFTVNLREDNEVVNVDTSLLLKNADQKDDNQVSVPKVVG